MASIKMCDIDGVMFVERAPGSVYITDAAIYGQNGVPKKFSGDLCPQCGGKILNTHTEMRQLPPPKNYADTESPKDELYDD